MSWPTRCGVLGAFEQSPLFLRCRLELRTDQLHVSRPHSSAALNYSMVAAGQLDLYWEIGCWSWDVCAGTIIAREAGGKVYGALASSPFALLQPFAYPSTALWLN